MKIEDSFVKALIVATKKFPVLKQPKETKVQLTIQSIMQIAKEFHKAGWNDSDPFGNLFGGLR